MADGGPRREPELPVQEEVTPQLPTVDELASQNEFETEVVRARSLNRQQRLAARQASLDPGDGLEFY